MGHPMLRRHAWLRWWLIAVAGTAAAQPATEPWQSPDVRNPPIPAVRIATPPKIDGILDDETWKSVPAIHGFFHELQPAAEETTVRCGVGPDHLYFAFACADPNPSTLRAQQKKRNGSMGDEDTVTVGIDALADRRTMYWFTVNPLGTQSEEIPGGAASKIEWRGDWQAAAQRTATGWTAELAIPFELLRYPPGQRKFGLIFRRHVSRTNQESCWPIRCNYYTRDNQASWENLEAPRIRRRPLVMPYAIVGAGANLQNDAGVDIKYQAENNITGLFTFRPDFQTIEDVIDTVDFSYNPRRLDDKRPFFTEGSSYFNDSRMFYSRTIGQVTAGLKGFGKVGRISSGVMDVGRIGRENDALMSLNYDVSRYSDVGFGMVDHRADGIGNTVLKLRGSWWKPLKQNTLNVYATLYQSLTSGQPDGDGTMLTAGVDRWNSWGELGWHLNYRRIPKDYNAMLAYVPEKGIHGVDGWLDYGREIKSGPLLSWSTYLNWNYTNHIGGGLFDRSLEPGFDVNLRNGMSWGGSYLVRDRPPFHDGVAGLHFGWNVRDLYRRGDVRLRFGRQAGGDYRFLSVGQGFKISEPLSFRLSAELLRLNFDDPAQKDDRQDQIVLTGLYDLSAERGISLRAIRRTSGFNFYAAYRQELRRGADVFFIIGDPNADKFRARLALKMVNTY
jgi:hypothetical protein